VSPRRSPSAAETRRTFAELAATLVAVYAREMESIERLGDLVCATLRGGRTVFFCGNGGSAAEAQHFATELAVRFVRNRGALPALALGTDVSSLTATGNDFGFARIFARQIEALGRRGDLLVAMTTSGRSPNVLEAVRAARARGLKVAGMTGENGKTFARRCDVAVVVPSRITARIQEIHLLVGHLCCARAEALARGDRRPPRAGRRARPTRGPARRAGASGERSRA
jgi:D-sedoheptulose 7-phosphate isomerase